MMTRHAGRTAVLLGPLLLAACGGSAQQRTTQLLDNRLADRLAPAVATGHVALQRLPDGARVTLLDPSMFPNDAQTLDGQGPDLRANVIEGLLDPRLMRVQVTDTSTLPPDQQALRVRNVAGYFIDNGLGPVLVAPTAQPANAGPAGLRLTINVACPPPNGFIGYGDGTSKPVCE
jgi:hypothetical protein